MGSAISFVIPGPIGHKMRLRLDRRSGRLYTPTPTLQFERRVREIAEPHFRAPFAGPVILRTVVIFPVPKSWPAYRRHAAMMQPHVGKPDLSNIEKAIEDALNGVAYLDDSLVAEKASRKRYGLVEEIRISIEPIPSKLTLSPEELKALQHDDE